MEDKIKQVFEHIRAEEELKHKTVDYLKRKIERKRDKKRNKLYIVTAALLLFILAAGGSMKVYYMENVYIDIDVNPSFELKVNRFNKVTGVSAYNEDGSELLKQVNMNHKTYDEAVRILIAKMEEAGFLMKDGFLSVTLQSSDKDRERRVASTLEAVVFEIAKKEEIQADFFIVSEEVKNHAHENHLTPAKYLAILELQDVDPAVTIEECRNHSISQIKQQVSSCRHGTTEEDTGCHHNRHHE